MPHHIDSFMVNLSVKLPFVSSEGDPDDDDCWKDIGGDIPRSAVPAKLRYLCRLLQRSYSLGVKIERFYVTDTEDGRTQHRRIKLSREMIHALAMHGSDFSYGVFSPFFRSSRCAVDGYYVLRFSQKYEAIFQRFADEKMRDFYVFPCRFGKVPYFIFDADEDGLEYFLRGVADLLPTSGRNMLLQMDYFTNGSWCWPELESETIEALDRMHASVSIEVHPNMGNRTGDRSAPLWRHVFRMARTSFKAAASASSQSPPSSRSRETRA